MCNAIWDSDAEFLFWRIGMLSTTIQPKWLHTYILIKVDLTNTTSCEDSEHSSTIIVCFLTAAIHVVKQATHQNLHAHTSNYESKLKKKKTFKRAENWVVHKAVSYFEWMHFNWKLDGSTVDFTRNGKLEIILMFMGVAYGTAS